MLQDIVITLRNGQECRYSREMVKSVKLDGSTFDYGEARTTTDNQPSETELTVLVAQLQHQNNVLTDQLKAAKAEAVMYAGKTHSLECELETCKEDRDIYLKRLQRLWNEGPADDCQADCKICANIKTPHSCSFFSNLDSDKEPTS